MYAEIKDNVVVTWPYDYDTLCKKNPSTAFPANTHLLSLYEGTEANLSGSALVKVSEQLQPSYDEKTQTIMQADKPVLINGNWQLEWVIAQLTEGQQNIVKLQKAASVRSQRNQLLKDSDWTQLDDTPFDNAKKMAWANYRQALRDIPDQAGFPWGVQWPTQPE